jgi:hypothetical protein
MKMKRKGDSEFVVLKVETERDLVREEEEEEANHGHL